MTQKIYMHTSQNFLPEIGQEKWKEVRIGKNSLGRMINQVSVFSLLSIIYFLRGYQSFLLFVEL